MSKNKRAPEHLSYDNGDNNVKKKRDRKKLEKIIKLEC